MEQPKTMFQLHRKLTILMVLTGLLIATNLLQASANTLSMYRRIEFQVTTSTYQDYNPDIDGSTIVWNTVGISSNDNDIQGYNLNTGEHLIVSNKTINEWLPRISSNWVVWIGQNKTGRAITSVLAKDLVTGEERTVVSKTCDGCIYSLDISGNYITWADGDIWLYHIPTRTITQVTNDSVYQDYPAVDAPWVVWRNQDNPNTGIHIVGYNIDTSERITVSLETSGGDFPDISNGVVVWQHSGALFGKDLSSGMTFTITNNSEYNSNPRIKGDTVVWSTYGSINDEVYMYNISTAETFTVTSNLKADQSPSISGNVVVWRRYDNAPNDWNIYGVRLYRFSVFLPLALRQ